jgi:hypothetical protein
MLMTSVDVGKLCTVICKMLNQLTLGMHLELVCEHDFRTLVASGSFSPLSSSSICSLKRITNVEQIIIDCPIRRCLF